MLLKKYIFSFLVAFSLAISAQPAHEYFFNNTLTGPLGPALTQTLGSAGCPGAAGAFGTQTLTIVSGSCGVATAFCFNMGAGLKYPNPSYITNQYTIHVFFKFNTLGGYSRIIDFSSSTSDNGIYLLNNCLNFYPTGNVGACPFFAANTYYLFTFVRNSSNIVTAYVNGVLFTTYNDAANDYRCATNTTPITFFRDDNTVPCEAKAGCIKYLSVNSATSTAAQVATVWTNICSVVLPVELSKFEGTYQEDKAQLNWTTETESNNKLFEIERSADGIDFSKIGEVKGNGDSHQQIDYDFIDPRPNRGVNYYRLKQINHDGSSKHSTILTLDFEMELPRFYPNPAEDYIIVDIKNKLQTVSIKNLLGQELFKLHSIPEDGKINLNELPNGSYILSVGGTNHNLIIKK